jgi:uncharacterized protein (DUF433 family)
MTSLEKVQALLPEMTYYEKLNLLEYIAQDLSHTWPGIESTPGVCGGVARIAGTRIPVWTLVGYKLLGATDLTLLQAYPTLTAEDLSHAWSYYREHKGEIDQQIAENEAE